MDLLKRLAALLLGAACCLSLSACTIPVPGYSDYDVSGYIQALLDSSYHDSHDALVSIAKMDEESARENNTATVENAAIRFCNTYGIAPSSQQLQELQMVMKQAFALGRYTVKEERKADNGYYLEVEVNSILNFEGKQNEIERMRQEAQQQAMGITSSTPGDGEDGGQGESSDVGAVPTPVPAAGGTLDPNDIFVEKVLGFCKQELANISYDEDPRVIPLDIIQTEDGELQLDMDQIDMIDTAVIRF